jgi:tetratricopeptide (TPR) repeat protein
MPLRSAACCALMLACASVAAQAAVTPLQSAQQLRAAGRLDEAIAALRSILARDPGNGEARLELAFALEQAGDLVAARYHLELALGAELAPAQKDRALLDLRRIREASTTASFAINTLPPVRSRTVVDSAGNATTVTGDGSYGLGIVANGRLALGDDLRNFVRGTVDWRDYGGRLDDFLFGQASAGRVFRAQRTTYSAEVGALASQYQRRHWYTGGLLQGGATVYVDHELTWTTTALARRIEFTDLKGATANQAYLFSDLRRVRPGSIAYGVGATAGASRARDDWRGFDYGELRASWLREFRGGVIVEARTGAAVAKYRAIEPGFTRMRRDVSGVIGLDFTLREWSVFALAPRFSVAYTRLDSNVDTYDSRRATVGVGLTSSY